MSKRNIKANRIEISAEIFTKIMSWAQALDEIVFLAAGNHNLITEAFRLTNHASAPRNHFFVSTNEERSLRHKIKSIGLNVICMGHSHPNRNHLNRPSKMDYEYLPRGTNQIIVFPLQYKINVWKFEKSYLETIKKGYDVSIYNKNF